MEPTLDNFKLSCELLGHSLDVRAVAAGGATPDGGQLILSGSRDKSTKLWKPVGCEEEQRNESVLQFVIFAFHFQE